MPIQKLYANGLAKGFFVVKQIKDIDSSPTDIATTEVIDLDDVKDKLVDSANQRKKGTSKCDYWAVIKPKSCDGLKLIPEKSRIDFIEFKGFEDFKKRESIEIKDVKKIEKKVKDYNLGLKIKDSCHVFGNMLLVGKLELSSTDREFLIDASKNYIVMVDIGIKNNPEQNFAATMQFLSQPSVNSIIQGCIESDLGTIDLPKNINDPVLMSANDIDRYYNSLQIS